MCVRYIAYLFCLILLISFAFLFMFLCVSAPVPTSFWAVLCTTDTVLGIRASFLPQVSTIPSAAVTCAWAREALRGSSYGDGIWPER